MDQEYFNNLEKSILDRLGSNTFLLESGIPSPYIAPEGYFELLETRVYKKTFLEKKVFKLNTPWFRAAAAIVLVSAIGTWAFWNNGQKDPELAQVSDDVLYNYVQENLILDPENTLLIEEFAEVPEADVKQATTDELLEYLDPDLEI